MSRDFLRNIVLAGSISVVAMVSACRPASTSGEAGSTAVVVQVANRDGSPAGPDAMRTVRDTVTHRLTDAGLAKVSVAVDGSALRISVAGGHSTGEFNQLLAAGQLRFRKVIDSAPDARAVTPLDPASPSAPPSSSATPSGAASPQQSAVLAKLGAAAAVAATVTDPSQLDAGTTRLLEPFRSLTPAEVATLPVTMQFAVPQVTCQTLNNRPTGAIDDPSGPVVACEHDGPVKYLLDRAKVVGTDVAEATASIGGDGVGWKVDLTFTGSGAPKWTDLTAEAFGNVGGACRATSPNSNGGAAVCQVAIVLDNEVLSAPAIQGVLASTCQITGSFDRQSATALAAEIRGGAIPYRLNIVSISSTSS